MNRDSYETRFIQGGNAAFLHGCLCFIWNQNETDLYHWVAKFEWPGHYLNLFPLAILILLCQLSATYGSVLTLDKSSQNQLRMAPCFILWNEAAKGGFSHLQTNHTTIKVKSRKLCSWYLWRKQWNAYFHYSVQGGTNANHTIQYRISECDFKDYRLLMKFDWQHRYQNFVVHCCVALPQHALCWRPMKKKLNPLMFSI